MREVRRTRRQDRGPGRAWILRSVDPNGTVREPEITTQQAHALGHGRPTAGRAVGIQQRPDFVECETDALGDIDDRQATHHVRGGVPRHEQLRRLAERKLPDIEELILHATAVRRWLKMTSACDCDSLDVCSLFDDRVLSLDGHTEARAGVIVIEPPRTATPNASRPETAHR